MKRKTSSVGVTLVEVMIAMFLVSVAAVIVYTEMLLAYRFMMRSRARVEAQSIAFDRLWTYYNNTKVAVLPTIARTIDGVVAPETNGPTPEWSILSTNGQWELFVIPSGINPIDSCPTNWDMVSVVWPPANSLLRIGTNALARIVITRYHTADRKDNL